MELKESLKLFSPDFYDAIHNHDEKYVQIVEPEGGKGKHLLFVLMRYLHDMNIQI